MAHRTTGTGVLEPEEPDEDSVHGLVAEIADATETDESAKYPQPEVLGRGGCQRETATVKARNVDPATAAVQAHRTARR